MDFDNNALEVTHDRQKQRYQIDLGNQQHAVLDYHMVDGAYALTHTYVPPAFRGQGIADRLAAAALDTAEAEGRRVMALCSFIAAYIRRNRKYAPLLVE